VVAEITWNEEGMSKKTNTGDIERALSALSGGLLVGYALLNRSKFSLPLGLIGIVALYRGVTGHCPMYEQLQIDRSNNPQDQVFAGVSVRQSIRVDRPVHQVYPYWRDMINLPRFLSHLSAVQPLDDTRSRWTASASEQDELLTWQSEILFERENELIVWRSLPGYPVDSQVVVEFVPVEAEQATEVFLQIIYAPARAGNGGSMRWNQVLGRSPEREIKTDLERFKALVQEI
jgi:uncharacterized membrane protein